jgi:hypothetical protein
VSERKDRTIMCPSSRAEVGAVLLGYQGPDGKMAFLKERAEIDQEFLDEVGERPEERFRFSSPCLEHQCSQWDGCKCKIPDTIAERYPPVEAGSSLGPCVIRAACRWYDQVGADACRLCPMVVTDQRGELDEASIEVLVSID